MDIGYSSVDVRALLRSGQKELDADHKLKNELHQGTMRVAEVGCVLESGDIVGNCVRKAHLRFKNLDTEPADDSKIMFGGGFANEWWWERLLNACEHVHEIGTQVTARREIDGKELIGHPDIIIYNKDGEQEVVFELKKLSAVRSTVLVHSGTPDIKHLIQTATYMWVLGLPGVLCYTNNNSLQTMFYKKQANTDRITPFYKMFYVAIKDGTVYFREEHSLDEVKTIITLDGITEHLKMTAKEELAQRPLNVNAVGEKEKWDACGYCEHKDACDLYEHSYKAWIDNARLTIGG